MGNRAHVIFHRPPRSPSFEAESGPPVYLHWNGGPESIYAFLDELKRRGVRTEVDYATARFVHVVADFMDHGSKAHSLSLGVSSSPTPSEFTPEALAPFDHGDNGVYVVVPDKKGDGWTVGRRFVPTYGSGLREMTRSEVAAEKRAAYKHEYHKPKDGSEPISETLRKTRPFVEESGREMPEADEVQAKGNFLCEVVGISDSKETAVTRPGARKNRRPQLWLYDNTVFRLEDRFDDEGKLLCTNVHLVGSV